MSKENEVTVSTYSKEVQIYVNKTSKTVIGSIKVFLDNFLSYLDKGSDILEIGSGTGRDADYIENLGYKHLMRTDAAKGFVDYMNQNGHKASQLNIINETLDQKFDAVLADAVFLHFNDDDMNNALKNTKAMLNKGGIFALSLHSGSFRGMSDHKHSARYFHEWNKKDITELLYGHGLEVLDIKKGQSTSGRKEWMMIFTKLS